MGLQATTLQRLIARASLVTPLFVQLLASAFSAGSEDDFFEAKIRPILVQRCEGCHSAEKGKTKGGLALDSFAGWQKGGESGPVIVPGKVDESPLIRAIQYHADGPQMPPEEAGGKLPEHEIVLLAEWIAGGAHDPRVVQLKRGGLTDAQLRAWWSFQPVQPVVIPDTSHRMLARNEIDHFIHARLAKEGLSPASEADRRTLIRRVTYDLTGLPPTPGDVDAFVADESAGSYEAVIDRLLQSPHYGERWGRHWLDQVRYADTAGENSDHPIPDAWRYRNWVIDAFNRDLPYDAFVKEQLAGDLLHANDSAESYAQGVIATGYLAIARRFDHDSDKWMHLTFEDTIDTLGRTFLGLSVACARCHDHKFDPISANDYYALYGILESTKFAFPGCEAKQQPRDLISLLTPADWAKTIEPYERQLTVIDAELKQLNEAQAALTPAFKAAAAASTQLLASGAIDDGGSQAIQLASDQPLDPVDVQPGQMLQLIVDPAENYGADTTLIDWEIAEVGGDSRKWNLTQDVTGDFLAANPHADRLGNKSVWLFLDGRNGPSLLPERVRDHTGHLGLNFWGNGANPCVMVNSTDQPITVWTTLPPRSLFVHPAPDGPVAIGWVSPISGKVQITGRVADSHPGGPNGVGWRLEKQGHDMSVPLYPLAERSAQLTTDLARRAEYVAHAPMREVAYAVTEGTVANAHLHLRGDPEKLGEEVPRRWLEILGGHPVPSGAGSGRLQLAEWIVDPANPLTARVMVNRLWLHHFGHGLVQTPNDFGTRGQLPTHPELLDWLAVKFVNSGWSFKSMHRLILLSATYRQSNGELSAEAHEKSLTVDPNNNLLWRFDRQRLDAEELRDTLLTASQQLDAAPGGPHPIPPTSAWSFTQHVPFSGVPETDKRSIYQITLRNRREPFMGLFDGADPNATTPQRQVTTVPTQSLYFMNDAFFHRQAEKITQRVLSLPGESPSDEDRRASDESRRPSDEDRRAVELFRIVLQRLPSLSEQETATAFLARYTAAIPDLSPAEQQLAAWSAYTRILLSSNEFLYLD